MNDVFEGMESFVLVYLNDILVLSKNPEEHAEHVRAVLTRLIEHNFYAKRSKCEFFKDTLKFLAHILSKDGISVDPEKVKALLQWPAPRTVSEIRQFVGLANVFRKFVDKLSVIAKPLTDLTKSDTPWVWGDKENQAFEQIKSAMCSAPVLAMPDTAKDFTVICDASAYGMGAVLMQEGHPVAYWSRLFNPAQQNYTVTDRELMAVVEALKHWRCYLGDKLFTVITDHSPLTHFSTKKELHGRQARWAETLAMYSFNWQYRPGRTNVADPFSRHPNMTRTLAAVMTRGRLVPNDHKSADTDTQQPVLGFASEIQDSGAAKDVVLQLSLLEKDISKGYAFDPVLAADSKHNHRWHFSNALWFTAWTTKLLCLIIRIYSSG